MSASYNPWVVAMSLLTARFKRYNDRHGHQAGDACLRDVAATVREGLRRPADLLARYGGEEFVGLLPETGLQGALTVATELERRVRQVGIAHGDSDVAPVVTISIGVASSESSCGTGAASGLVALSDQQLLYFAKRGRAWPYLRNGAVCLKVPRDPCARREGRSGSPRRIRTANAIHIENNKNIQNI